MRLAPNQQLERLRQLATELELYGADGSGTMSGCFAVRLNGAVLRMISDAASEPIDGHLWEHVSVSLTNRCPTWAEMCFVKDLFWSEEETVLQFHPPRSEYVNVHKYCLHLWRPLGIAIPTPPRLMV